MLQGAAAGHAEAGAEASSDALVSELLALKQAAIDADPENAVPAVVSKAMPQIKRRFELRWVESKRRQYKQGRAPAVKRAPAEPAAAETEQQKRARILEQRAVAGSLGGKASVASKRADQAKASEAEQRHLAGYFGLPHAAAGTRSSPAASGGHSGSDSGSGSGHSGSGRPSGSVGSGCSSPAVSPVASAGAGSPPPSSSGLAQQQQQQQQQGTSAAKPKLHKRQRTYSRLQWLERQLKGHGQLVAKCCICGAPELGLGSLAAHRAGKKCQQRLDPSSALTMLAAMKEKAAEQRGAAKGAYACACLDSHHPARLPLSAELAVLLTSH